MSTTPPWLSCQTVAAVVAREKSDLELEEEAGKRREDAELSHCCRPCGRRAFAGHQRRGREGVRGFESCWNITFFHIIVRWGYQPTVVKNTTIGWEPVVLPRVIQPLFFKRPPPLQKKTAEKGCYEPTEKRFVR